MPRDNANRATNILLVDDDAVDVESVRRAFSRANIRSPLWVANDGEEGLRMLRGTEYPRERRLVLLDLNLPRKNGIEVLREIRDDTQLCGLSVVILTTSNDERDRRHASSLNAAGYLVKPPNFGRFVELMDALNRYWAMVEIA